LPDPRRPGALAIQPEAPEAGRGRRGLVAPRGGRAARDLAGGLDRPHPPEQDHVVMGSSEPGRGVVYFIGAGPGDPDLLTVGARALIARCPVCLFAGSLVPRAVVAFASPGALVRNSAGMDLEQLIGVMAEASGSGKDVARVHSGAPSLYG